MLYWDAPLVKLKGFQKLTSTDEALSVWFSKLQLKKPEETSVPLQEALGRVLTKDLIAKDDLPRFDRSAMDGYAVKSEYTVGASQFKPAIFQITEAQEVKAKEAKQIWTGNPIPKGADSVVMIENTRSRDGELEVWAPLALGDNVARKGEDIKKGEVVAKAGTRLNPYHVGLAAALGYRQVSVARKPRIAIVATGNELAEVGSELSAGQIYDSNKVMLSSMCQELGAEPMDLGIVTDDLDEIILKIKKALQVSDAVITIGGTSVGGLDLVPDAINRINKPGVVAHGLALKPAMPTGVGILNDKPIMILSGNPVASIIGFEVFGRPLISRMLGMEKEEPRPVLKAVMTRKIATTLGRKTYVRVNVSEKNGELVAEPVSAKGSGAISTMTRGNGFILVPESREGVREGETVTVHMYGLVEAKKQDV